MSNASRFRTEPNPEDFLQSWIVPTQFPLLKGHEVHLWRASLNGNKYQLDIYNQWLSPDERQRAARFKFEHLQQRFIAGRGILRALLGQYLAIAPDSIQFTYGTHGKPFLQSTCHPNSLSFNLAHSQDRALFTFSRTGTLGVDIEHLRQDIDVLALSQRFFTQREHQAIASLPSNQHVPAFFCLWTCKEAYLKATGEGLVGLQSVEIDILPNGTVRLHQRCPPSLEVGLAPWHVYRCWPQAGYVGAIALTCDSQQTSLPIRSLPIRLFEYAE